MSRAICTWAPCIHLNMTEISFSFQQRDLEEMNYSFFRGVATTSWICDDTSGGLRIPQVAELNQCREREREMTSRFRSFFRNYAVFLPSISDNVIRLSVGRSVRACLPYFTTTVNVVWFCPWRQINPSLWFYSFRTFYVQSKMMWGDRDAIAKSECKNARRHKERERERERQRERKTVLRVRKLYDASSRKCKWSDRVYMQREKRETECKNRMRNIRPLELVRERRDHLPNLCLCISPFCLALRWLHSDLQWSFVHYLQMQAPLTKGTWICMNSINP